jgi:hypothetical protein
MKAFRVLAVIVAGVLLAGSVAVAQRVAASSPDPLVFSAAVKAEYTDNRDGTATNKADNFDLILTPRADLRWRDGERSYLDLFLEPMLKWHSNPRSRAAADGQHPTQMFGTGGFDGMHMVTPRLVVGANDTIMYTDDPDISQGGTAVRRSASYFLNRAMADVNVALAEKLAAYVVGAVDTKRYSDSNVGADNDEDTYSTELDAKYLMGMGWDVFAMVGWTDFNADTTTTRDRGSSVMSYGLGVDKIFNPDFKGKIVAGYQTAEYDDPALGSTDTANGRAELTLRANSPTRFRVGASYGYFMPYVRPYSVQTLTAVDGHIDHDVVRERLTLSLSGQYSEGEYDAYDATFVGGTDRLTTVGVGAKYKLNRNWSVSGGYTYETWDSDVRDSFNRNTVNVGVKAQL